VVDDPVGMLPPKRLAPIPIPVPELAPGSTYDGDEKAREGCEFPPKGWYVGRCCTSLFLELFDRIIGGRPPPTDDPLVRPEGALLKEIKCVLPPVAEAAAPPVMATVLVAFEEEGCSKGVEGIEDTKGK
jgi:hypothetical protein